jgi:hypothetical protein
LRAVENVASNAAEPAGTFWRAEAPAHLLLELYHPQVSLGQLVGTMKGRALIGALVTPSR